MQRRNVASRAGRTIREVGTQGSRESARIARFLAGVIQVPVVRKPSEHPRPTRGAATHEDELSKPQVLLVDDDPSLLDVLSMAFGDAGYDVATAEDGSEALEKLAVRKPDLLVTDINMPVLDGFTLLKRLRDKRLELPVILLTSRDNEIDESLGLELGADDYVAKPFSTRVLLARMAALLRRERLRASGEEPSPMIACGALELRVDHMLARYAGHAIETTVTEFRLLEAFARRPGVVLSRERLMELGRGDDSIVGDRIIDTYVRRLRRKLEAVEAGFDRIETVIGAGYRWKA